MQVRTFRVFNLDVEWMYFNVIKLSKRAIRTVFFEYRREHGE
jgi:hypothetical protein